MSDKTLTRMDLSEAVFKEVGLSRNESARPLTNTKAILLVLVLNYLGTR